MVRSIYVQLDLVLIRQQSPDANTPAGKRVASLYLDTTSTPYTLNADEKNRTMIYMASAPSSTTQDTTDTPVNLKMVLNDMATVRTIDSYR